MAEQTHLVVDGCVERPLNLSFADLATLPESAQVKDVSRFHPTRKGDGVMLDAILHEACVLPSAAYVTLHADRDDFHVSIPLEPLRAQGIIVYGIGSQRLGIENGGPFRFLIRDPSACHTDQLDECANVKFLSRIEITERRGRDTRPEDEEAHRALHEQQDSHAGDV